jgi:hypothetical protein
LNTLLKKNNGFFPAGQTSRLLPANLNILPVSPAAQAPVNEQS